MSSHAWIRAGRSRAPWWEDRLRQLPCFASGELQFTRCHDTEWHQIFVVENESTKAVVSQPSWTGLDALRIVGRKLKA